MPLMIRPADLSDAAGLHKMIQSLAHHHGDVASVSLAQLHRDLFVAPSWAKAFVADQDGQLVGYAIIQPLWRAQTGSRIVDLHHLYVDPDFRGVGIGTRLIKTAQSQARTLGASQLTVGTMPTNLAAQKFYQNLGMQAVPRSGPRYVMSA